MDACGTKKEWERARFLIMLERKVGRFGVDFRLKWVLLIPSLQGKMLTILINSG